MGNGNSLVGDDGDRQAHDRKLLFIPATVYGVDITLEAILTVVEIGNHQIKSFDDGFADCVDGVRSAHEDKVVASDMADKSFRPRQLADYCREDAAGDDQHFVSTSIAVAVVERLEIVDVEVGEREGLLALDSSSSFTEDGGVTRQACEGIRVE